LQSRRKLSLAPPPLVSVAIKIGPELLARGIFRREKDHSWRMIIQIDPVDVRQFHQNSRRTGAVDEPHANRHRSLCFGCDGGAT
jgi:hypothetical protein